MVIQASALNMVAAAGCNSFIAVMVFKVPLY